MQHYMWINVSGRVCLCFFWSYSRKPWRGQGARGGPGKVRDVQGSSMHNENLSSPHSFCSEVYWNERRVSGKGKKGDSSPLLLSLVSLSVWFLNGWFFFKSPIICCLLIMFVSSQCAFWSGCSWLAEVRRWCVSMGRRGLARGWCG